MDLAESVAASGRGTGRSLARALRTLEEGGRGGGADADTPGFDLFAASAARCVSTDAAELSVVGFGLRPALVMHCGC